MPPPNAERPSAGDRGPLNFRSLDGGSSTNDSTDVQPGCCASCPRSFVTNCSDGCVLALPAVTS